MDELWHDAFAVVAKIARDPARATADRPVIGDHAPLFWSSHDRAQFDPDHVAWTGSGPGERLLCRRRTLATNNAHRQARVTLVNLR